LFGTLSPNPFTPPGNRRLNSGMAWPPPATLRRGLACPHTCVARVGKIGLAVLRSGSSRSRMVHPLSRRTQGRSKETIPYH
jgi:hypothetical protein